MGRTFFTDLPPEVKARRDAADARSRERWKNQFTRKVKIVSVCECGQIKSAKAERCAKCAYVKREAIKKLKLLKVIEIEESPKLAPPKTVLEIPVAEKPTKPAMELRPFREDATITQLLARAGCLRCTNEKNRR